MIPAADLSPDIRARSQAISRGISDLELALGQVYLRLSLFVLQCHAIKTPYYIRLLLTPINLNFTAHVQQAIYAERK